jgi:hypothetical protein
MDNLSTIEFNGYDGNRSGVVGEGRCAFGSKNLLFGGNSKATAYKGPLINAAIVGGRVMFNSPDGGWAGLGNHTQNGIGSIVGLISRVMGFIGQGLLIINGGSRAVSASTAFQLLLYKGGSYFGGTTGPVTAGLNVPTAPVIATTPNASTINSGTTSARIHYVRSTTGARSRASTASNVLVVDGFKVRVTIDAADLTYAASVGIDRIGIDLPAWGFGSTGPHYQYIEIATTSLTTVDGVANSYELEYSSTDLVGKDLAPIDDFTPPAAVFAVAVMDVVALIGCYGDTTSGVTATTPGSAIAVSLPLFPESYPPDNLLILPEPPVGVLSRASDGFCFVGCKNSMHALTYTGGRIPLNLQTVWSSTGIAAQHNMCIAEGGRLYAYAGQPARINNTPEPDTEFGDRVSEDMASWIQSAVVLGWDAKGKFVVYAHGQTILAFNVQTEEWSTPLDLSTLIIGNICATVTVGNELYFATENGANVRFYAWNSGTGSIWEVWSGERLSVDEASQALRLKIGGRFDNTTYTLAAKMFRNGDRTNHAVSKSMTPTRTGFQILPTMKLNVRGAKTHSIYLTHRSTGGDDGPDGVRVEGTTSGVSL